MLMNAKRVLVAAFAPLAFVGCATVQPPQEKKLLLTPEAINHISSREMATKIYLMGLEKGNDAMAAMGLSMLRKIDPAADASASESVNLIQPVGVDCNVQKTERKDGKVVMSLSDCSKPKMTVDAVVPPAAKAETAAASAPAP